jgi:predicted double-glycine peptidase
MEILLPVKSFQETLHAGMCGPASLKMVLAYYGVEKSESELAQLTHTDVDLGTTTQELAHVAESFGFRSEIHENCELSDIELWLEKGVPVIVDWFTRGRDDYSDDIASADGHYSVVCGINDTHIFLQDPETGGMRKMQREVFRRVWFDFSGEYIRPDELIIRQLIAIYK